MTKNRHDLALDGLFSSLDFRVGVTLQAPESFLTMVENQRVSVTPQIRDVTGQRQT